MQIRAAVTAAVAAETTAATTAVAVAATTAVTAAPVPAAASRSHQVTVRGGRPYLGVLGHYTSEDSSTGVDQGHLDVSSRTVYLALRLTPETSAGFQSG